MKKRALNIKLVGGGIMAVVVPLLIVGWFTVKKTSEAFESFSGTEVRVISHILADMTRMAVEEKIKFIRDLSVGNATITAASRIENEGIGNAGKELGLLNKKLQRAMKEVGRDYEYLLVADMTGRIISDSADGAFVNISVGDREYFQTMLKTRTAGIGKLVKSRVSGKMALAVYAPVFSDSGKLTLGIIAELKTGFFY